MRLGFAAFLLAAMSVSVAGPVRAETRMFIVANQPDGYGIDRCLAEGESCGRIAARTYCQAQQFADAAKFSRVEAEDITGTVRDADLACTGSACGAFVAITCQR